MNEYQVEGKITTNEDHPGHFVAYTWAASPEEAAAAVISDLDHQGYKNICVESITPAPES